MDENSANASLELIRRKEFELADRIRDAELKAKEKLAAAKTRASEIRKQAESVAKIETERFYKAEMERAQVGAAELSELAKREADELTRRGAQQLERAVGIVIDFIFPS